MATGAPPDLSGKKEFLLKEYESLRKEIEWMLTDIRALERNVLVAVGVTWAWLFTHKDLPSWVWFLIAFCAAVSMAVRSEWRAYLEKRPKIRVILGDDGPFHVYRNKLHRLDHLMGEFGQHERVGQQAELAATTHTRERQAAR